MSLKRPSPGARPPCSFRREQFSLQSSSRHSPQESGMGALDSGLTPSPREPDSPHPPQEAGLSTPLSLHPVQGGTHPCICLEGPPGSLVPWLPLVGGLSQQF